MLQQEESSAQAQRREEQEISPLARAAINANYDDLVRDLGKAIMQISYNVRISREIPFELKGKTISAAIAQYVNRAEPKLNGRTALMLTPYFKATHARGLAAMRQLMINGADLNLQDYDGNTTLHQYLIQDITNISHNLGRSSYNPKRSLKVSPASKIKSDTIKLRVDELEHYRLNMLLLCQNGADPTIKNKDGCSVIDILHGSDLHDFANLLEKTYHDFIEKNPHKKMQHVCSISSSCERELGPAATRIREERATPQRKCCIL
jgi:ankyrin repeat protein